MKDFFQELELYLTGNLAPDRVAVLENRIQTDPAFAQKVQLYMKARASIDASLNQQLRQELKALDDELLDEFKE